MDTPLPFAMESGSPHARYALIHQRHLSQQMEHIQLPYAWEQAAQVPHDNGRADWAAWLRTSRAFRSDP
jgi:hypothetical protein